MRNRPYPEGVAQFRIALATMHASADMIAFLTELYSQMKES